MAVQTLTTLSSVLMNDYDPVIRDQRNKKSVLVDKLEKNVGVQIMQNNNFLIKLRQNHHSGWYSNNGAAGAALNSGQPTYNEATVPARFAFGTHILADTALVAMDGKPGAIVDIAEDFAMSVKEALRKERNRMYLGLGGTEANNAEIGVVNGAVSGTAVILERATGTGAGTTNDMTRLGTRFIRPGQILDIGTDAELGAGTAEAVTVDTVDSSTQFTATASETLVDGDIVQISGADNNEMNGLKNVVSASNTFQNIARTSAVTLQAYLDNTAEALDETDMVEALLQAEDRNGDPNVIIAGGEMYKKYASLLSSMKRTANSKEALVGGFTGLEFAAGTAKGGVVVLLDQDTSFGDVWFLSLSPDYIAAGELAQGWLGIDQGQSIFQKVDQRPSYWATYRYYGNLVVRGFAAHSGLRRKTA